MSIDFRRLVTTTDKDGNQTYSEVGLIAMGVILTVFMTFVATIVIIIVRPHEDNGNIITLLFGSSGSILFSLLAYLKITRVANRVEGVVNKVDENTKITEQVSAKNHEAIVQAQHEISSKVSDIKTDVATAAVAAATAATAAANVAGVANEAASIANVAAAKDRADNKSQAPHIIN